MLIYENRCVGCTELGLPCQGSTCSNRNVPVWSCDWCNDETDPDELREVGGQMVCEDCIMNQFEELQFCCEHCGADYSAVELYNYDGRTLCRECIINEYDKINVED